MTDDTFVVYITLRQFTYIEYALFSVYRQYFFQYLANNVSCRHLFLARDATHTHSHTLEVCRTLINLRLQCCSNLPSLWLCIGPAAVKNLRLSRVLITVFIIYCLVKENYFIIWETQLTRDDDLLLSFPSPPLPSCTPIPSLLFLTLPFAFRGPTPQSS